MVFVAPWLSLTRVDVVFCLDRFRVFFGVVLLSMRECLFRGAT
jgi:hypothetical protein